MHPAVVHFPVASWTAVVVTDALYVAFRDPFWARISLWLLVVGVVTALGAMTAGLTDLAALPEDAPARRTALTHMILMSTAWTVFAVDLLVRFFAEGAGPLWGWVWLAISAVGFAALAAGAHIGARLVYDLGVGQTARRN